MILLYSGFPQSEKLYTAYPFRVMQSIRHGVTLVMYAQGFHLLWLPVPGIYYIHLFSSARLCAVHSPLLRTLG